MSHTPPKDQPTIIDYLRYNRTSFGEQPLNGVDSVIFSTAAFMCLERGVLGRRDPNERIPLPMALCGLRRSELFGNTWLRSRKFRGDAFLTAFMESPRFMECSVGRCVSETNDPADKQFGAVTFYLPDNSVYVAYRGTDGSINGWREDFNLCFMSSVPSMPAARHYLEEVAVTCPPNLYVGGHSKGGVLAEYAACTCSRHAFEQISRIFNHDGPGFSIPPSPRYDNADYLAKLEKTVPGNGIIGMVMEDRPGIVKVVAAKGLFILEHAGTNWCVDGDDFMYYSSIDDDAQVLYKTVNTWSTKYTPQQRGMLVDALFDVLEASEAKSINELDDDWLRSLRGMRKGLKALPDDLKEEIFGMVREMRRAFIASTKTAIKSGKRTKKKEA